MKFATSTFHRIKSKWLARDKQPENGCIYSIITHLMAQKSQERMTVMRR